MGERGKEKAPEQAHAEDGQVCLWEDAPEEGSLWRADFPSLTRWVPCRATHLPVQPPPLTHHSGGWLTLPGV